MLVKATRDQLEGIALILSKVIVNYVPDTIEERFVYMAALKAYKKINNKALTPFPTRSGWSISLTDEEAMGLHIFLRNVSLPIEQYRYEGHQVQKMSDQIHQLYG